MNNNKTNKTRGDAMRAGRRNKDDGDKRLDLYAGATELQTSNASETGKLKVTFLGGLNDVGEKNMAVIEFADQALILDCGINLSVDLPGVNYAINDTSYLETIKHKIRGYVITHGHLDHIGGLRHTVPNFPAPIYGSRYTIGIIEKTFNDEASENGLEFKPELVIANIDNHQRLKVGLFTVEFIRVTHSIPDPTAICIETPAGRIIATGDFRLDPEPLDNLPTDTSRLAELGKQGLLLLMSDSSYADSEGRTPTEHTLQDSFTDVITRAPGRIFVAVFSSNINRTQMIINAAAANGRKVALDGRSMLAYIEIAVRQGILKVPKGTIIAMREAINVPDDQLLIMCTGGQGEPNAALQRMSKGEHKFITLKSGDTVLVSSSPIPGNEVSYDQIGNRLSQIGVQLFRHPTHELDGCGPLHVSGHARRDELREMIRLTQPTFFVPVHAGTLRRRYHAELGVMEGIPRSNTLLPNNGDSLLFTKSTVEFGTQVPHKSVFINELGKPVQPVVIKDKLLLSQQGMVNVVLTINKLSGQLVISPDIISRGFIDMRANDELLTDLRTELRRAVQQRFNQIELDRFKAEIREFVTSFFFAETEQSPMVVITVNTVATKTQNKPRNAPELPIEKPRTVADEQARFQAMRAHLLKT